MNPTPTEAARALAALRPRTTITCEVCGAERLAVARKKQPARTCGRRCRDKLRNRQRPRKSVSAAE